MLVVALDAVEVCSVFFWFYCLGALPHQTKHVAQPCVGLADVTHWEDFGLGELENSQAAQAGQKSGENKLPKAF